MTSNTYFIIGSSGRTGTQWLANALNRHPEILVAHSVDWNPIKNVTDPVEKKARQDRIIDHITSGSGLDIDKYFDSYDHSFKFLGNIHGIDVVGPYLYPHNLSKQYEICLLTRHPVSRIQSMIRKCHRMGLESAKHFDMMHRFYLDNVHKVRHVLSQAGVTPTGEDEENFICSSLLVLGGDSSGMRTRAPVFRMEDFTTKTDSFTALVRLVTRGALDLSEATAADLMAIPPTDAQDTAADPRDIIDDWADWQRSLFFDLLERTRLRPLYHELGYRL